MTNLTIQNQPSIFQFENASIRTLTVDGEAWFVATDVAATLGYSNPSKAINDHCKGVTKRYIPTTGGTQEMNVIPERDVYRLIMRSQLPSAERFEEWVVGEVLPAIRKTGGYNLPTTYVAALEQLIYEAKHREANQHKVDFFNAVADSSDLIHIGDAAKILAVPNLGRNTFFQILRRANVLMENRDPYQRYIDAGYFMVRERTFRKGDEIKISKTTMVTQKGLDFLRRMVVKNIRNGRWLNPPNYWQLPNDPRQQMLAFTGEDEEPTQEEEWSNDKTGDNG